MSRRESEEKGREDMRKNVWVKESVCERERGGRRTGKKMANERRKMGHLRMMLEFAIRGVNS